MTLGYGRGNPIKADGSHWVYSESALIARLSAPEAADRIVSVVARALAGDKSEQLSCDVGSLVSTQAFATQAEQTLDREQIKQGWEVALANLLAVARKRVAEELKGRVLSVEEMELLLGSEGPRLAKEEPGKFPSDAVGFLVVSVPQDIGNFGIGKRPGSITIEVMTRADWLFSMGARDVADGVNAAWGKSGEASRHASGLTPLAVAAMKMDVDTVVQELAKGADPKQIDRDGVSALDYARMRVDTELNPKRAGAVLGMIQAVADALDIKEAIGCPPSAAKRPGGRI